MEMQFLPSDPQYAEMFSNYRNDPVTQKFNPVLNQTLEELKKRLSEACSDWSDFDKKESFIWFVSYRGNTVGTASMHNINRSMLTAEIGYGVFPSYRGQGIGSKIIKKLTSDAFQYTKLRKLIAFVHEKNNFSKKILEKNGFIKEGMLREHYLIHEVPADEAIYGILRKDVI